MQKIILFILLGVFAVIVADAETKIKLGIAGDTYFANDNDKISVFDKRKFTNTNIYKNSFGTNNVLVSASAKSDSWKANVAIATFGQLIQPEEANIGLRLFEGLWITGGVFTIWDDDYTYNKWFAESSLTDLRNMGNPYVAWGLEYVFSDDVTFGAGLMNTGFFNSFYEHRIGNINDDVNYDKTIYAKLDWNNLYKDWDLVLSCVTGNEGKFSVINSSGTFVGDLTRMTEIYASISGTIIDNLEAKISGKYFRDNIKWGDQESDALNMITFQTLLRYRFNEKFAAGIRFSYLTEGEFGIILGPPGPDPYFRGDNSGTECGIVCEYNPTPFTYLRLEGGMLSISNSNDPQANRFYNGTEGISSRLSVALSMGFKFSLFEKEIK